MSNCVVRGVCLCIVVFAVCSLAWGQSQTGSLSGTILDANSSAIPGATIDATLAAAGVTLHAISNDVGLYVFPNLPPGIWTIAAEKPGFKKLVREGIEIFIAQRQTLNIQLEVGDVQQRVEVTATQTSLDIDTSERG